MYVIEEKKWGDPDRRIEGEFIVGYHKPNGGFYVEERIKWIRYDPEFVSSYQKSVRDLRGNAQEEARALCSSLNGGS